jgi:hypothetical protein
MIEPGILIATAIRGCSWLRVWHEKQANPPHIPDNAILVFKRFKEAYDAKSIGKLSSIISDSYRGDLYGVPSKQEFIDIQKRVFNRLPWGVYPCLSINVYSIVENERNIFSAIIDTHSIATVFGIPLGDYDSAPVRCQIRPEDGLWLVSEMFVERRLSRSV